MGKYTTLIPRIPVYVMFGQSNMDGRGYYPTNPSGQNGSPSAAYDINGTNADMKTFYRSTWSTTKDGAWANIDIYDNNVNPDVMANQYFGAEMAFLKEMSDYKAETCYLVKACQGGTSLHTDWQSGGTTYLNAKAHIEDAINKIVAFGTPVIRPVIWFQGWSDTDTEAHANAYEANLNTFITNMNGVIQDMVSTWTPRYLVQQSPIWTAFFGSRLEAWQTTVRTAQQTIGQTSPNLFIDNTGLTIWTGDDIHLEGAVYETIGINLYNELKDL